MFPILSEIRDYIVSNIELFIIIIIPLATLIVYLARRITKRIETIESNTWKDVDNRISLINEKIEHMRNDIREIKQAVRELEELKVIKGVLDKMKYW